MRLLFIEVTIMTYDKDKMRETAIKNLGGSEAMYNKYLAKAPSPPPINTAKKSITSPLH